MTEDALLTVLQFADGLFPAGGFAHSFGLETYVQDERIRDADGVAEFVGAHLEGSAGPCDAVAAVLAARHAAHADVAALVTLDARLEAMKPVPEFRVASRQMGRQTLRIAVALADDAVLSGFASAVGQGLAAGHHAVVFGAALGRAGVSPAAIAAAYLHATAVMLVGAGVRLLALGQVQGQQVLARMRPVIGRLARTAADAPDADRMWSFTPGLDLAGLRHAALDTRLFRS